MLTWRAGRHALLGVLAMIGVMGVCAAELEQEFAAQLAQAQAGNVQAMYEVGQMYELGMGTDSSRSDALNWYRAAADKGHAASAYQVGYAYYWGKGLSKDRHQALLWFERAANAGNQAAIPYLSKMYALGQGVAQDKAKAAEWAQRASTDSNVHKPPPAPEVRRAPPARVVQLPPPEPEPAPVAAPPPVIAPVAKAAPEPEPKAAPEPKPKPQPAPKPKPKPAPQPKPKPKPSEPPARVTIERLQAWHWQKAGRPALYLPSAQTGCEDEGEQLSCKSAPRRSSLLGRPYAFRVVSVISAFDKQGGFAISYRPQITGVLEAPPGGYGEDGAEPITEAQLRERVEREPDTLTCTPQGKTALSCTDARGQTQVFEGVEPGTAAEPLSTPRNGNAQADAAPRPSPPPPQAEPEEPQRSRIFGRRP